jgi:hypothetical protein
MSPCHGSSGRESCHRESEMLVQPYLHQTIKKIGIQAGLKHFGPCSQDELLKELHQFHLLECFNPLDHYKLSRNNHHKVLSTILFLAKKSNSDIKAYGCADG